jgi:hypothetical protein
MLCRLDQRNGARGEPRSCQVELPGNAPVKDAVIRLINEGIIGLIPREAGKMRIIEINTRRGMRWVFDSLIIDRELTLAP